MYNYKLVISYDGGRYDGWTRGGSDESLNTIESKISEVLKKMTGEEIELFVACRTEKGVHAYEQVCNCKLNSKHEAMEISNYLNRYLPRDISCIRAEAVEERFHSQLNVKKKTYVYRVDTANIANVFERKYAYHTFDRPDVSAMRRAAEYFVGSHDYKAFTTAKKNKSTEKTVYSVDFEFVGDILEISITANDFMHNMARLMFGMLLDVGGGLRKPESIKEALEGGKVTMSLPAETNGLFLKKLTF